MAATATSSSAARRRPGGARGASPRTGHGASAASRPRIAASATGAGRRGAGFRALSSYAGVNDCARTRAEAAAAAQARPASSREAAQQAMRSWEEDFELLGGSGSGLGSGYSSSSRSPRSGSSLDDERARRLREVQAFRLRHRDKFFAVAPRAAAAKSDVAAATDADREAHADMARVRGFFLPEEPEHEYVLQSYTVGEDHRVSRVDNARPDEFHADVPPRVHEVPRAASYVRVSVPKAVARAVDVDEPKSNAQLKAKKQDLLASGRETMSVYGYVSPGLPFFKHFTDGLRKRNAGDFDVNRAAGRPTARQQQLDAENFLYQPPPPHLAGGAQAAVPDFRGHYATVGVEEGAKHRHVGRFSNGTVEQLTRLAHMRAGLQTLHHRLWRTHAAKGLDRMDGGFASEEARSFWASYSPFPNL